MTENKVMTSAEIIKGFRERMEWTESDWYRFCLRYADRSIKTPISYIVDMYGSLPYGFKGEFRSALRAGADKAKALHL